jgi:hypothetical protein
MTSDLIEYRTEVHTPHFRYLLSTTTMTIIGAIPLLGVYHILTTERPGTLAEKLVFYGLAILLTLVAYKPIRAGINAFRVFMKTVGHKPVLITIEGDKLHLNQCLADPGDTSKPMNGVYDGKKRITISLNNIEIFDESSDETSQKVLHIKDDKGSGYVFSCNFKEIRSFEEIIASVARSIPKYKRLPSGVRLRHKTHEKAADHSPDRTSPDTPVHRTSTTPPQPRTPELNKSELKEDDLQIDPVVSSETTADSDNASPGPVSQEIGASPTTQHANESADIDAKLLNRENLGDEAFIAQLLKVDARQAKDIEAHSIWRWWDSDSDKKRYTICLSYSESNTMKSDPPAHVCDQELIWDEGSWYPPGHELLAVYEPGPLEEAAEDENVNLETEHDFKSNAQQQLFMREWAKLIALARRNAVIGTELNLSTEFKLEPTVSSECVAIGRQLLSLGSVPLMNLAHKKLGVQFGQKAAQQLSYNWSELKEWRSRDQMDAASIPEEETPHSKSNDLMDSELNAQDTATYQDLNIEEEPDLDGLVYGLQIKAGDYSLIEHYGYETIEFDVERNETFSSIKEVLAYLEEWESALNSAELNEVVSGYISFFLPGESSENSPREMMVKRIMSSYVTDDIKYHIFIEGNRFGELLLKIRDYVLEVSKQKRVVDLPKSDMIKFAEEIDALFQSLYDFIDKHISANDFHTEWGGASGTVKRIGAITQEFAFAASIPKEVISVFDKHRKLYHHMFKYIKYHEVGNITSEARISVEWEIEKNNPKLHLMLSEENPS